MVNNNECWQIIYIFFFIQKGTSTMIRQVLGFNGENFVVFCFDVNKEIFNMMCIIGNNLIFIR